MVNRLEAVYRDSASTRYDAEPCVVWKKMEVEDGGRMGNCLYQSPRVELRTCLLKGLNDSPDR